MDVIVATAVRLVLLNVNLLWLCIGQRETTIYSDILLGPFLEPFLQCPVSLNQHLMEYYKIGLKTDYLNRILIHN